MIPPTISVALRVQVAVVAALVTIPAISSAAEQEPSPRHSLIQRSAAESSALPGTTHGTILQPSNTESTHITSPIESHKPSVSPTPMPSPQHRTLTKRPPIASITAPPTSSQAPSAAGVSGIAEGQPAQATADITKNSISAGAAPITKPAPLAGVTSTASTAPTAASPLAGAAGAHSAASAGSGSAPLTGGSRSAANLLQNSAIMSLLIPSTPVVTTPPPPPATPPSTPPLSSPSTGSVTLTWTANSEPDLAGYKIYVGTNSGVYNSPGSPFVAGKVTSYTISNLPKGQTYFFAISAYDSAGNESVLSAEVSRSLY